MKYAIQSICATLLFFACIILASCIEVEDFGTYWEQGKNDEALFGSWIQQSEEQLVLTFRKRRDAMAMEFSDDDEIIAARHILLGGYPFLMLKGESDGKGGTLHRYTIAGDVLTFYSPNPAKREAFAERYSGSGIALDKDTVSLGMLDARKVKILGDLAGNATYWEATTRYTKQPAQQ